jgi:hypothetical protein
MRGLRLAIGLGFILLIVTAAPVAAVTTRFSDGTAAAGLPTDARTSWGTAIVDFNGDGWPDILLNRHTQPPALFVGSPTGFVEDTDIAWTSPMDRHNCAWGEANGDGRPDLLCVQGTEVGNNELWLNTPDGFVESADAYGLGRPHDRARTATWIDYDQDGDLDLFLGNVPATGQPDVIMRNDGGVFSQTTTGIEAERDTESASWSDWDHNGYPDLLLTNGITKAHAFTNNAGTFSATTIVGLGKRHWLGSAWGDFNGDGWPDLAVADPRYVRILVNNAGTFTTLKSVRMTLARDPLWVDLDNDGRLDLYVVRAARGQEPGGSGDKRDWLLMQTEGGDFTLEKPAELAGWHGNGDGASVLDYNQDLKMDVLVSNGRVRWPGAPRLLANIVATSNNAAAIRLRGSDSNPLGMGTVIQLTTSAFSYTRELNDGVTWNGQSDVSYVHLGLRDQTAGNATVTWPNGTVDCVPLSAGAVVELHIGTSPCS